MNEISAEDVISFDDPDGSIEMAGSTWSNRGYLDYQQLGDGSYVYWPQYAGEEANGEPWTQGPDGDFHTASSIAEIEEAARTTYAKILAEEYDYGQ